MSFTINNNDPEHVMYDKLNEYIVSIKKLKYGKILKLLNDLFNKNYKSLRNFIDIDCNYFTVKNNNLEITKKIIKILELHKTKLNLNLQKLYICDEYLECMKIYNSSNNKTNWLTLIKIYDSDKSCSDSDDTNSKNKELTKNKTKIDLNKEIFSILIKVLKTIEYKFKKTKKFGKEYYFIAMD